MQRTATHSLPIDSRGFSRSLPAKLIAGLAATLVVAAAAHISFPLPFTAVPLTLQPLAVLGVGLFFGPVGGFLVMLAYLTEGAAGLPVFSPHPGLGGVAQLLGPTGGYLMSYPLVAALTGGLARSLRSRVPAFTAALIACTSAVCLLYACGAGWLMTSLHLSPHAAFIQGILPFLPGEVVKILAASGIYSALARPRAA